MAASRAAKKEMRRQMKERLSAVSMESVQRQSARVVADLLSLPNYRSAQRISVYLSMPGGEVQTSGIVRDALAQGKEIFVPFTHKVPGPVSPGRPSAVMEMVRLKSVEDYEGMKPDKWGIPTPDADSVAERDHAIPWADNGSVGGQESESAKDSGLDLIVVPGMAFDASMGRLGHGAGFYDFFFHRYKAIAAERGTKMPFLVGLALREQLLDTAVPMDESDWRVDALVTGDGICWLSDHS